MSVPSDANGVFCLLLHAVCMSLQNISCVVGAKDSARALRTVHAAFLLSHQTVSVGVVGCGSIGGAFLDIVQTQVRHSTILQ
jgi:hypothetical protein